MTMRQAIVLASLLLIAAAAFADDTQSELPVSLQFVPQDPLDLERPDLPPALSERAVELRVDDARSGDPMLIGEGTNDDDRLFPIRATGEVIEFLDPTLHDVASAWGLTISRRADLVLTLRVTRFFVEENNMPVGSVYRSEARLGFVLTDGRGRVLAEGAESGVAHRYGRSRSADNCNEVLSDALQEAFANVLSGSRLRSAWSRHGDPAEERLRRLDQLYRRKLITRDEYERKRAEILGEL